jgi:hypothetical protein
MPLIKRLVKGTPLTFAEGDANLDFLENLANTTGSFATTGSNQFIGTQTIFGNLTVYGTSSISHITSSQLDISTNLITVNTSTPSIRFGGLAVYDSGSTGLTGSMLWDSQANHWIYTNPSGSSYSSGMLISGPRNTGSIGNEQGTTLNALMKGQGGDHITSSALFEDGSTFTSKVNTVITGSLTVTGIINGSLTGSIESASFASTASQATNATSASYASIASQATNATSASYAMVSNTASYASIASQATNATSASYAMVSNTASYAMVSNTASYAATSTTASYALAANSASYAIVSETASFAMMSDTASYAMMVDPTHTSSYSLFSVSASNAISSSYAFNAISSSVAISSSFSSFAVQSTSSSYALSASNALSLDGVGKLILATTGSNTFRGNQTINGILTVSSSVVINGVYVGTSPSNPSPNIVLGSNALNNLSIGAYNTSIGELTLPFLITGSFNTALGYSAGNDLQSGSYNTFLGRSSGGNLITGSFNTFIGSIIFPTASIFNNTVIIADGAGSQRLFISSSGLAIFSDGIYASGSLTSSGSITLQSSTAVLSQVSESFNFANDLAASGSGIPLGGLYHTSGTIKIRLV